MTPIEYAQTLAESMERKDRILGIAIIARGLSDDDGLRQGWPLEESVRAAIDFLGLGYADTLLMDALTLAPTLSDAILNKGAARAADH